MIQLMSTLYVLGSLYRILKPQRQQTQPGDWKSCRCGLDIAPLPSRPVRCRLRPQPPVARRELVQHSQKVGPSGNELFWACLEGTPPPPFFSFFFLPPAMWLAAFSCCELWLLLPHARGDSSDGLKTGAQPKWTFPPYLLI